IPPMSERENDVILLTKHFLQTFASKYSKKPIEHIDKEAEALLKDYAWPGNVRELRNVIERCVVMENIDTLTAEYLPLDLGGNVQKFPERRKVFQVILPEEGIALETVEREYIRQALERSNNNMTKAAKLLQVSYDTLRYHTKKYELIK
ncbi:MAG: sigma-54-dependent Fis family transcriptional regulator, partial [Desulfuromonadales bacterium]|nr:sigma-54-dependent Fis family transcriptional regulator [Desulfuromonadales bacterium]